MIATPQEKAPAHAANTERGSDWKHGQSTDSNDRLQASISVCEIRPGAPVRVTRNLTIGDALAAIEDKLGRDALPHFLQTPQPGLGGQTGSEALEHDPEAVFDALEADPLFDRLPQRRSSKAISRLIGILESLKREGRPR